VILPMPVAARGARTALDVGLALALVGVVIVVDGDADALHVIS
jgi:hypothetical protein